MKPILRVTIKLASIIIPMIFGITILTMTIGNDLFGGLTPSVSSFIIINFLAYLFFLWMPVEAIFVGYLFLGYNMLLLYAIVIPIAIISLTIDYYIGYALSGKVMSFCRQSKDFCRAYNKSTKKIRKYGGAVIFLFTVLPLSSPFLLFTAGIVRYRYKKAILYTTAGLLLKHLAIIILYFKLIL